MTFIDTFPVTFIINVDRWEVYSKDSWITLGGKTPFTCGAPIHVYEVPSTWIKPAQPVTAPFVPLNSYISRVFDNLGAGILTRLALAAVLWRMKSADVENPKEGILTPKSDYLTFSTSSSFWKDA